MGRRHVPTELKLVQGTQRPSRVNKREPKPKQVKPAPPAHLSGPARSEWLRLSDELFQLGVLTRIDRAAFAAYCQAYGRWVQAEQALAKMAARDLLTNGLMIKTTNGNAIQNPLVGTANKAMLDMMRFASEFGMTPAARARIEAGPNGTDEGKQASRYF
jgi:P27 family predicted phage terminase small subunit